MTPRAEHNPPVLNIAENDADFSARAAHAVVTAIETSRAAQPLIVLPTGNTPLGLYRELAAHYADRRDLWDRVRFLALDEYAGLELGDPRLFYGWVARECLDPLNIKAQNRMRFNSNAPDREAEIRRVDLWVAQNGPIDVAVLGLGTNGHIAFNEPGSSFAMNTHLVSLTQDSINANAQYWGGVEQVPAVAFTLGLGQLAQAHKTILLVSGAHKARILEHTLNGPVTTDVPATYLRAQKDVHVIADRAACAFL